LIVHIKRFQYTRRGVRRKLTGSVRFPLSGLDLSPFTVGRDPEPPIYDLYGVTNHHGYGLGSGHYSAYAMNPAHDQWFHFNDARVSRLDEGRVQSSDAYVLFYSRMQSAPKVSDDAHDESKEAGGHVARSRAVRPMQAGDEDREAGQTRTRRSSRSSITSAVSSRHVTAVVTENPAVGGRSHTGGSSRPEDAAHDGRHHRTSSSTRRSSGHHRHSSSRHRQYPGPMPR
jgi:hypothetical protein